MNYNFIVNNEIIRGRPDLKLYTGNTGTYTFEFEFDEQWADLQIFVTFTGNSGTYVSKAENNRVTVPQELLVNPGSCRFGVYGTNSSDDIKRMSSNLIELEVVQGAYSDGTAPDVPTPDLWEALVTKTVPIIGENGNWWIWSIEEQGYIDSGVYASQIYDDTGVRQAIEKLNSAKVDKVEGEGLSETKSVKIYSKISGMIGGTVTSPIRMPEVEDFIYVVSQDGRNSTVALYNSTQIDNIITSANAAFGTRISYKTITDDVFDETLNAGWYKITSADETKNYISTWMLVTRITNDYHTSKDVIPIARQIIFGEGSIKHRTYFGKVKQFEETIIQPWSIDAEEKSADVSTFAALPYDRTEYLDTYWSDWEIGATQGYVEDRISDSIENKEDTANKVTVLSESSTDEEYPSAKAVYDYVEKGINPIVKAALEEITTVNTIYDLGVQTELVITLPSGQVGDFIQVDFISRSTATTLTVNSSSGIVGFDLIPAANTIYTLYFDWGVTGYDGTDVTYGWRFNYSEYSIDVV